ncbi:DUF4129 domain-containing protein [Terrabacter sp. 2RAF25]|uniref:DUF4129 domain-containing protein n=1 Tax=Terrabacter sp. 2RAF25 TaxID=3232998 RepID=UPI003F9DE066
MTVATAPPSSPPLDPSVEQAKAWLARELAAPAYADTRNPIERLLDWLNERLGTLSGQGTAPGWALPLLLLVVALVVAAGLFLTVRRSPRSPRSSTAGGVLVEPHLTAADYRARSESALARGDLAAATADAFRAMAASAAERTLLDDVPGRTAHEIGTALAVVFPAEADAVRRAADLFDGVVYGRVPVGVDDVRGVLDLDVRLRATRPALAAVNAGAVSVGAGIGIGTGSDATGDGGGAR